MFLTELFGRGWGLGSVESSEWSVELNDEEGRRKNEEVGLVVWSVKSSEWSVELNDEEGRMKNEEVGLGSVESSEWSVG